MVGRGERAFVSAQRVADYAGVSRSAVSRTFTPGASVSQETRRRVMEAADALGYHVNHLARGLTQGSGIVCLVAADVGSPYQARMIDRATRRLQEAGKVVMLINTAGESDAVARALRQTLNYRAEATVVISGTPSVSLIETCVTNGQHVILINRDDHIAGPDTVSVDNESASAEAFAMLARAGCRRLALVNSEAGTPSLMARERAFGEAARRAGFELMTIRIGPTGYAAGAEAARQLLSRAERPDAAFCVTDLLACGFMDAARTEFNLRIPEDLCVVGFDDIEQAGWAAYNLTTFRQPIDRVAEHITGLVTGPQRAGVSAPTVFQAVPVWRRSVRP